MSWVYQIQEVKTHKGSGEPYVLVHFWPTRVSFTKHEKPAIEEGFTMQLRPTGQRAVTDVEGKVLRQSGIWASHRAPPDDNDPPVTEPVAIDLQAQIKGNIERFLKLHRHVRGSLRDPAIETDESDPHGILARPDVAALSGKDFDEPEAHLGHP